MPYPLAAVRPHLHLPYISTATPQALVDSEDLFDGGAGALTVVDANWVRITGTFDLALGGAIAAVDLLRNGSGVVYQDTFTSSQSAIAYSGGGIALDQYAEITLGALATGPNKANSWVGVSLRVNPTKGDALLVYITPRAGGGIDLTYKIYVDKISTGHSTGTAFLPSITPAAGDVFRAEVNGDKLSAYYNGDAFLADTTIDLVTVGSPGLATKNAVTDANDVYKIASWRGGPRYGPLFVLIDTNDEALIDTNNAALTGLIFLD